MKFRPKKNTDKAYKYKDLRTYASTEWLAEGKKKYRTVFENIETRYIYAELSFHNKLFDAQDWQAQVVLKCFRIRGQHEREELCKIHSDLKVSQDQPVVYVREGWGNQEPGLFWTRGDYVWEAYIEDELVGTKLFYVENGGPLAPNDNPYFEIQGIRLFEGTNQGVPEDERKYYRQFDSQSARYIWAEIHLDNLQEEEWFCELQFNFYNAAGQLKGQTQELRRVAKSEDDFVVITGWGANAQGSWYVGSYTLELVFMDHRLAIVPFEVGTENIEGEPHILEGYRHLPAQESADDTEPEESFEEVMERLNRMIGLERVKKKIEDYTYYLKFLQIRKERGFVEKYPMNLHAVFKGNPGTGKTTIAKMLGSIYHNLGLLSKGKVVEVSRAELVGQYIGQTAPRVKEIIEQARGGVLFIDEAYALIRNNKDSKDYGHEVIETLVKEMSDGPGDLAIIVAGYPKEMEVFLQSNPGLKSRFNIVFEFPDYLPQELSLIAELAAKDHDVRFEPDAKALLDKKITEGYRTRDRSFGNARLVYSLVEESKMNLGLRIMKTVQDATPTDQDLRRIQAEDVRPLFFKDEKRLPNLAVDEELLRESLSELNAMIGLGDVKDQIKELVRLVKFYRETGRDVLNRFSLHAIFKGNPGTGKTSVARILARIYKALGILERGHIVECDRQSLVAGYVGQTAIKTQEKIEEALGGVLFIDEAYALTNNPDGNDFGREAIEVILKQMEDRRGEFIVIVAGYPSNMDKFIESNPGLKSRFDRTLTFKDFAVSELMQIALQMLQRADLQPDTEAIDYLQSRLKELYQRRDHYFGNARTVRKIIDEAIKKQHLRMSNVPSAGRTPQLLSVLNTEDLRTINFADEELSGREKMGFRMSDRN
ncbi:MAG: AAA family ATPase [Bernardetiaceae bacterium]